jgi:hypothetical protein
MEPLRADPGPRPSVLAAWIEGWRRVFRAPVLVLGTGVAWVASLGAFTTREAPALNNYLAWIFQNDAYGFGGPPGLFARAQARLTLSDVGHGQMPPLLPVTLAVVLLMFLAGGTLDLLARDRRIGTAAFFAACGTGFERFLRIGVVLGLCQWLLTMKVGPWLLASLPDVNPANGIWQPRALAAVVLLVLIILLGIIGDYAQVRTMVEDRRSALGAISGSLRFIWRRPIHVLVLYGLNVAAMSIAFFVVLSAVDRMSRSFNSVPPSATAAFIAIAVVVYTALALMAAAGRLAAMATAVAFFQNELAHAGYTAAPVPTWPNSPAVEAIANIEARQRGGADRALPL